MRRVLDNRDAQPLKVAEIALFTPALWNSLDLLNLFDLKASVAAKVALDEEGDENGPLRVGVNTAAGATLKGSVEEGCAGGRFVGLVVYQMGRQE